MTVKDLLGKGELSVETGAERRKGYQQATFLTDSTSSSEPGRGPRVCDRGMKAHRCLTTTKLSSILW